MDDIAKQLNITDVNGWYKVTNMTLQQLGGTGLLAKHDKSVSKLLTTVYPEYNWNMDKFRRHEQFPAGYWDEIANQREFVHGLVKKIGGVKQVSINNIKEHGGQALLARYDALYKMLASTYPEYTALCKMEIHRVMQELKVENVEKLLDVSQEYRT